MHGLTVAGMFRSGTTLLARLLSASPGCLVVADPFVYFFKAYRDFQLERAGARGWHPQEPTPDYFLGERRDLLERLLAADLREPVPAASLTRLRADIRAWKSAQHPALCERLDEVGGGTFAEVYRGLIDLAVELYGDGRVRVAGSKVSWCEEFLPALARAFPGMRFVLVVRDLRAVVASQNSQRGPGRGKRPLLFHARHWRKSVALAQHYRRSMPARFELVRYEDLVARPVETMQRLCTFAGIEFAGQRLAVGGHNSSYDAPGEGIFAGSTERWRAVLSPAEVEALEALVGPELTWLGYELEGPRRRPSALLARDGEPAFDELSPWLQPFPAAAYLRDPALRRAQYAAEDARLAVIEADHGLPAERERDLFLVEGVLAELREAWRR